MESMTNLRRRMPSILLAALVLALSRLQSTGAVDILFWSQSKCLGASKGWLGLAEGVCLNVDKSTPSIQVSKSSSSIVTRLYTGGSCTTEWGRFNGNICASGKQFTGARWNTNSQCNQLFASDDKQQACTDGSSGCKKLMDPNAVVYNSGEGYWVLMNDNATELFEQLTDVPDSEKVAWLTAQGATYTSKTEEKMLVGGDSYVATSAI
ncbi:hypothetical protein MPTK1_8g16650 [Marchantia polymorpha subsp. ruderalis]|uniref:C-type lectin domain-containing protein n=1 Tax=Marchantia polymorpha TaxID=3197 RepID=A0A2R6VXK9_MARPO|nr:hypothetical protein MARPO_3122s0001 [Marchantia polymorpha]BBN20128.1 hypothetical protein Mp_8g16650 [Marchantia polymorpha subsp. ruderalis]|eukprot:PTQ26303.1 hypothetical protein MARPO_3122s0001 [Marchantia polymorpha]